MVILRTRLAMIAALLIAMLTGMAMGRVIWAGPEPTVIKPALLDKMPTVADVLGEFSKRSPGTRRPGPLIQTKNSSPCTCKTVRPHEQVLATERNEPIGLLAFPQIDDRNPIISEPFGATVDTPQTALFSNQSANPGLVYIGGGSGGGGGGSGGGGSGGGGGGGGPVALPEPNTWAMLVIGMFLVGGEMRTGQWRRLKMKHTGS